MKGLSQEIIMNSVRDKKYDWVIDRLYDCWKHVAQNSAGFSSPEVPAGTQVSDQGWNGIREVQSGPSNIVIKINDQTRVIPIVDSVGDTWNVGLEFGLLGFKKMR